MRIMGTQLYLPVVLFHTGLSLSITSVVVGPALVVLIMIIRHPSAIFIRKLLNDIVYYLQDLEIT